MGHGSSSPDPSVDNHPYWSHLPKKYRFVDILGEGSYGKVLRCQEKDSNRYVAVKIPKQFQNDQEASLLKKLMEHKFDQHNIVKFHDSFNTVFGKAMVFETLDMSLLQYISRFRLLPMKLSEVRNIVQQVATALNALKSVGIIHGDLKLNNIMLVDRVRKPLELKVIDFGLAMKTSKVKRGKLVQILPYRAPEVILGLPLSEAIDMWALGNLMFNLVTGWMLQAATCEYDAINVIVKSFGQPADHHLENGIYTMQYFTKTGRSGWRIKTRKEYFGPKEKYRHVNIRTLDDWKSMGNHANSVERDQCFELLKAMLKLDPKERITPGEVLKHPFITNSFNSNDASGSAQKKPSVCPPPPQWEEKERVVLKHPFQRHDASNYAQKKRYVRPPPPQWSTPSDTDSCMIFNFGTNTPRSQPSPSIHESLNCEPPATAVMADANDNIQPDHQSPSSTVQPSGVMMVHPAINLGGQDYHRSLCKIKVGPVAPENTSELEDEESSVSLQAGLEPTSESIVEVKERRRKNRVQRIIAWMRKTFSCLLRNRNVMDTG
ncbi:homeodomain-interacting protein kinase 3-like isoform X2 [Sparus aurata]|uniref:homeodomain-interacting protein kinase 3-like isoform X2 n=1 Tax=Sparus aurata TaxID=8175 RepID=UPI0011C13F6B|nr:homeodomain-interacting protein kinase 3-like isoform X2 [Sparus aurata]